MPSLTREENIEHILDICSAQIEYNRVLFKYLSRGTKEELVEHLNDNFLWDLVADELGEAEFSSMKNRYLQSIISDIRDFKKVTGFLEGFPSSGNIIAAHTLISHINRTTSRSSYIYTKTLKKMKKDGLEVKSQEKGFKNIWSYNSNAELKFLADSCLSSQESTFIDFHSLEETEDMYYLNAKPEYKKWQEKVHLSLREMLQRTVAYMDSPIRFDLEDTLSQVSEITRDYKSLPNRIINDDDPTSGNYELFERLVILRHKIKKITREFDHAEFLYERKADSFSDPQILISLEEKKQERGYSNSTSSTNLDSIETSESTELDCHESLGSDCVELSSIEDSESNGGPDLSPSPVPSESISCLVENKRWPKALRRKARDEFIRAREESKEAKTLHHYEKNIRKHKNNILKLDQQENDSSLRPTRDNRDFVVGNELIIARMEQLKELFNPLTQSLSWIKALNLIKGLGGTVDDSCGSSHVKIKFQNRLKAYLGASNRKVRTTLDTVGGMQKPHGDQSSEVRNFNLDLLRTSISKLLPKDWRELKVAETLTVEKNSLSL